VTDLHGSTLSEGVIQIDTLMGGWEKATAGILVEAPRPALIETGPSTSASTVESALRQRGLAPDDLAYIAVSHIHLDHAGAVGELLSVFPKAVLLVHEKGARHMVDPSRLIDSASRVYGSLLDSFYGRMQPVEPHRIRVPKEREVIELGDGYSLELFDAAGHAKHHLGILERSSGTLFAGDAAGVRLPEAGFIRPATPPADFDFEKAISTLRRFREIAPARLVLAHFGEMASASETLLESEEVLRRWMREAEAAYAENPTVDNMVRHLTETVGSVVPETASPEGREKLEMLNGIHSNAAGLHLYLSRKQREGQGPHPR
jgi:glyoxylase-like metal-dependent hydrolase (beta-lactamase superfamily II)